MANHCNVKTRKPITTKKLTELLQELNQTHFKNNLQIEYAKGNETSWGPHMWFITYNSNNTTWAKRVCWLNNKNNFEMRHGGGDTFAWWIDNTITNEIAVRYNGKITDDGYEGTIKGIPDKYKTLTAYIKETTTYIKNKKEIIKLQLKLTPPEYHEELLEIFKEPQKLNINI